MKRLLQWRLGLRNCKIKKEASADLNVASLNREFLEHGLLRENAGQTGFFHQAVQEYFFAREVALHQSMEYVLKHVGDPEWAEVLVFVCGLIEDATKVVREVMKTDPYLAAKAVTLAKHIDGELIDALVIILIQNLKTKFEADIWFGKFYQEMLAVISIKTKTRTTELFNLFKQAYNQSDKALYDYLYLLIGRRIPEQVISAISFIEPILQEQANDVVLRTRLGVAYRVAGKFDESLYHLKKGLEIEPKSNWIWGNIGRTYKDMKDYENAEFYLQRSVELKPNRPWAHNHLGLTLLERKNYQGALEQFQIAIKLDWEYSWPHIGLAEIYHKYFSQPENAIKEFETALQFEIRPHRLGRLIFGLASALEAAGRTAEARQRYQEYLDRFPWGEHAPEALAALERLGV
jgi:tetratricopeptide (TPR) repeat protein